MGKLLELSIPETSKILPQGIITSQILLQVEPFTSHSSISPLTDIGSDTLYPFKNRQFRVVSEVEWCFISFGGVFVVRMYKRLPSLGR